jgi:hypothetical protein
VFLVGGALLIAVAFLGWKLHQLLPILRKLSEADLSSLTILPAAVEKYQEGVIKIGEAQVGAVTKLEDAVTRFVDLMFSGRSGDGLQEYDEGKASRVFEEEELVRQGIPREEAKARVAEKEIYSRMSLQR